MNSLIYLISTSPIIIELPGSRLKPTSKIIDLGWARLISLGCPVAETMISDLVAYSCRQFLLDRSKTFTSAPRFLSIIAAG
jgi:hypothetical protein